jgi:hypothetical protein
MKRTFIGGLLAAVGLSKAAGAQEAARLVDPSAILFSMPTISNDGPPLAPYPGRPDDADVVFHEDDWRQLEFFAADRVTEVQRTLRELKSFEAEHRVASGWRHVYVRDLPPRPILTGTNAVDTLARELNAGIEQPPIIFQGAGTIEGRVHNGFSLRLGPGAVLYGVRDPSGISVLGANLQNADDLLLTNAFTALNRNHGLLLVDWAAQMLLISVQPDGEISAWRP